MTAVGSMVLALLAGSARADDGDGAGPGAGAEPEGPRCRGRVRDRDEEVAFEVVLSPANGGPGREIALRPGAGPEAGRATVQTRLRTRLEAFAACYEPWVAPSGGPELTVRLGFDVMDGRIHNVQVDGAPSAVRIGACLADAVRETPMPCKLDAFGIAFPLHLDTADSAGS